MHLADHFLIELKQTVHVHAFGEAETWLGPAVTARVPSSLVILTLKRLILDSLDELSRILDLYPHRIAPHLNESVGEDSVCVDIGPEVVVLLTESDWWDVTNRARRQNAKDARIAHKLRLYASIFRLLCPVKLGPISLLEDRYDGCQEV